MPATDLDMSPFGDFQDFGLDLDMCINVLIYY